MSVPTITGYKDYSFSDYVELELQLGIEIGLELHKNGFKCIVDHERYTVYLPVEFSQALQSYLDHERYAGLSCPDYLSRVFNGKPEHSDSKDVEWQQVADSE